MVGWSSPEIARVADLVRETTGLVFPDSRREVVEATIQRFMKQRGASEGGLLDLLRRDGEALVAELTVGETYFERDPDQLGLLRRHILPKLLADVAHGPVRIWSAGCASGEEAYTLQIMCEEAGAADRVRIVGTDIARQRLAWARRGVFSKWSLRASSEAMRKRYFRERAGSFDLIPRIRDQVDFRYLNLAEDVFPSLATGISGMDVILCRNVLIYFDAPTVARVARRLIESLGEQGWLLLGASDPPLVDLVECEAVMTEAGVVYRRPGAGGTGHLARWVARPADAGPTFASELSGSPSEVAPWPTEAYLPEEPVAAEPAAMSGSPTGLASVAPSSVVNSDPEAAVREAYQSKDYASVRSGAAELAGQGRLSESGWVAWVRAVANQGCLEEAGGVTGRALAAYPGAAELHYLRSVLLLQSGRAEEAATAARHAVYTDGQLIVAHVALAEAERRRGGGEAAQRSLRNASNLLARLPSDSVVPASDGERAGRLAEMVDATLQLVRDQP